MAWRAAIIPLAVRMSVFWTAGLWAVVFGSLFHTSLQLLGAATDGLVTVVVALLFWALLMLGSRRFLVAESARLLEDGWPHAEPRPERIPVLLHDVVTNGDGDSRQREATAAGSAKRDMDGLAERAESQAEAWYLPVQALIWSLPAAGFLGTAWRLRGLATTLYAADPGSTNVSTAFDHRMLDGVSAAFLIICIALGGAVVAYVAMSLVMRADLELQRRLRTALVRNESGRARRSS